MTKPDWSITNSITSFNRVAFHDLRHSFATYARKAGVARNVIMIIMGHIAGNDMNFRYDTIDETDLLNAVDRIEEYLENVDHPVDQAAKKIIEQN
jgi:integrase